MRMSESVPDPSHDTWGSMEDPGEWTLAVAAPQFPAPVPAGSSAWNSQEAAGRHRADEKKGARRDTGVGDVSEAREAPSGDTFARLAATPSRSTRQDDRWRRSVAGARQERLAGRHLDPVLAWGYPGKSGTRGASPTGSSSSSMSSGPSSPSDSEQGGVGGFEGGAYHTHGDGRSSPPTFAVDALALVAQGDEALAMGRHEMAIAHFEDGLSYCAPRSAAFAKLQSRLVQAQRVQAEVRRVVGDWLKTQEHYQRSTHAMASAGSRSSPWPTSPLFHDASYSCRGGHPNHTSGSSGSGSGSGGSTNGAEASRGGAARTALMQRRMEAATTSVFAQRPAPRRGSPTRSPQPLRKVYCDHPAKPTGGYQLPQKSKSKAEGKGFPKVSPARKPAGSAVANSRMALGNRSRSNPAIGGLGGVGGASATGS
jgi:hypothetical protein